MTPRFDVSESNPEGPGGSNIQGDVTRKLVTEHRKLLLNLTKMAEDFSRCSTIEQFNDESANFD